MHTHKHQAMRRSSEINDALDILSSCFQELDEQIAKTYPETTIHLGIGCTLLDHAMSYLEREYTI